MLIFDRNSIKLPHGYLHTRYLLKRITGIYSYCCTDKDVPVYTWYTSLCGTAAAVVGIGAYQHVFTTGVHGQYINVYEYIRQDSSTCDPLLRNRDYWPSCLFKKECAPHYLLLILIV